jgi:hypothetical protein
MLIMLIWPVLVLGGALPRGGRTPPSRKTPVQYLIWGVYLPKFSTQPRFWKDKRVQHVRSRPPTLGGVDT